VREGGERKVRLYPELGGSGVPVVDKLNLPMYWGAPEGRNRLKVDDSVSQEK
jgi:hypothetical protein